MTSMFTVCPKCALTLAVTDGDLRVAQGYVRCGRCSTVFNALTRLSSGDRPMASSPPSATRSPQATPGRASRAGTAPAAPRTSRPGTGSISEAALEFDADVNQVFIQPPGSPPWNASASRGVTRAPAKPETPAAPRPREPEASYEVELDPATFSATLGQTPARVKPTPPVKRQRPVPPKAPPPATARTAPAGPQPASRLPVPVAPREQLAARRRMGLRSVGLVPATPDVGFRNQQAPDFPLVDLSGPPREPAHVGWVVSTGALSVLLALQVLNHHRNDLATSTYLNGPLTALYGAFGVKLVPRWDLNAYDVRQLGASADSARSGEITVRASVKNAAHRPQPLPLLRVTLQDRFGNRIAARDVPPEVYLPGAAGRTVYLSAGQRVDAEMAFVDPGANAVGFEIDACLPAPGGGTACASDSGER